MSISQNQSYEFGPFNLDPEKRLLKKQSELVPLNSKVLDVLIVLVEENGRVLEKDELIKRLWPDSFVEEGNLSIQVSAPRKALGETPNDHQYIVTIPGRGYRFAQPVRFVEKDGDFAVRAGNRSREEKSRIRLWVGLVMALALAAGIGEWLNIAPKQKAMLPPPKVIPLTSFPGKEVTLPSLPMGIS
jgi:DNA-binding winged helix-turn-helix (wHTH) protein